MSRFGRGFGTIRTAGMPLHDIDKWVLIKKVKDEIIESGCDAMAKKFESEARGIEDKNELAKLVRQFVNVEG